jgi:hypothetical protein
MKPHRAFRIGLVLTGMALPALSAEVDCQHEDYPPAKRKVICVEASGLARLLATLSNCHKSASRPDELSRY